MSPAASRRRTAQARDADIIILGGGCAGLSLAARLAQLPRFSQRVIVLEQRKAYTDDRTFSFWSGSRHPFESSIRAHWDTWRVGAGNRVIDCAQAGFSYQSLASRDFYDTALRLIEDAPGIELCLGTRSVGMGGDRDGAFVDTDRGRLRAELVVDTRPLAPRAADGLLQVFFGCEVETETDAFDPSAAELMMFDPPSHDHVGFCYALPFSRRNALLEYTRFTMKDAAPPTMDWALSRIRERLNRDFRVRRTEQGALSMHVGRKLTPIPPRLVRLGTVAGAARASTGYAFTTIQAQTACLTSRLRRGWQAALGWRAPATPVWMRQMDKLFLRVLRADTAGAPSLFVDLFENCPPAPLVRFLSGTGGLSDAVQVVRAMPVAPFTRALFANAP
jgi:lycopene beta-cyclase